MCFMAQSNQFIRVLVERVNQWICTYVVPRQGALLFWHCALFAPAPCPFEILAGALDTLHIHRMRNGQETHANRHEWTENFTVRYASVSAIR